MESLGFPKGTDKTKWREPVMAEKLGHTAHSKISAGKGKDEYGNDATTQEKGKYVEYKSSALSEKDLNNLSNVFMVRRKRRNMLLSLSLEYIMVIIATMRQHL